MSQIIEIPGYGEVEFPDEMSDVDISAAIRKITAKTVGWQDVGAARPPGPVGYSNIPPSSMTGDPAYEAKVAQIMAQRGRQASLPGQNPIPSRRDMPKTYGNAVAILGGAGLTALAPALGPMAEAAGAGLTSGYLSGWRPVPTLAGAATGYLLPAVAGKILSKVGTAGANKLAAAAVQAEAKGAQDALANVASKTGTYGGLRQTENKAILNLLAREEKGLLDVKNVERLAALKKTGRVDQAINETAANDLEFLESRTPEVLAAKQAMQEAKEGLPEAIAAGKARYLSPEEAAAQLKARLWRYGPPALGSAIGTAVGGPIGTAVGFLAGAGSRPMVQALRRMSTTPSVQALIGRAMQGAAAEGRDVFLPPVAQAGPATLARYLRELAERRSLAEVGLLPAAAEEGNGK